jgi:hypothetical protein
MWILRQNLLWTREWSLKTYRIKAMAMHVARRAVGAELLATQVDSVAAIR